MRQRLLNLLLENYRALSGPQQSEGWRGGTRTDRLTNGHDGPTMSFFAKKGTKRNRFHRLDNRSMFLPILRIAVLQKSCNCEACYHLRLRAAELTRSLTGKAKMRGVGIAYFLRNYQQSSPTPHGRHWFRHLRRTNAQVEKMRVSPTMDNPDREVSAAVDPSHGKRKRSTRVCSYSALSNQLKVLFNFFIPRWLFRVPKSKKRGSWGCTYQPYPALTASVPHDDCTRNW